MLHVIRRAVENIDWRFVRLSRLRYEGYIPVVLGDLHWLERPFAYEIYHQLRLIWSEALDCVIQAEVLKRYQEIRDLEKMPDLLFHVPDSRRNLAVVEIKLAANNYKPLKEDLAKLTLFRRILEYETLVEIIIGSNDQLGMTNQQLDELNSDHGAPIHVLTLSLDDHTTNVRIITYPYT